MRKLLLLSLWMPLAAFGSTVYSFSEPVATRGTVGFTYTVPNYLTEPQNYISAGLLTSCDTSGMQGWVCEGAWLNQTNNFGAPSVQISLNLRYAPGPPGDAFNMDEIDESFSSAQLDQGGMYHAFLNPGATFTVLSSTAPEPATWRMLAGAGLVLTVLGRWRSRKTKLTAGLILPTLPHPDDSPETRC